MTAKFRQFWRGKRSEAGAVAVEIALLLPAILMIYAAQIDLNLYAATNKKVYRAAGILTDLITRSETTINKTAIDDAFKGAKMALTPVADANIYLDVRGYRIVSGKIEKQWSHKTTTGPTCADPNEAGLTAMMASGNDIIVAMVCVKYEPAFSKALGFNPLGAADLTLREELKLRPRESSTLDCPDCAT